MKKTKQMKKIMIAAAIVCAAAFSQAATTSWNWNTGTSVLKAGYTGAGTSSAVMQNATIYLFATDATATSDKSAQIAILAALKAGTTKVSDLASLAIASGTTDNNGQILSTPGVSFDRTDVAVGATKYYYELVIASDDKGTYAYLSGLAGTKALDEGKAASFATTSAASTNLRTTDAYNTPGWYQVASVPEPTSGLLLLLGVAGLALKRKRA